MTLSFSFNKFIGILTLSCLIVPPITLYGCPCAFFPAPCPLFPPPELVYLLSKDLLCLLPGR